MKGVGNELPCKPRTMVISPNDFLLPNFAAQSSHEESEVPDQPTTSSSR